MANKTGIEWTDRSSNPIKARRRDTGKRGWHCTKVSDGCKHCYAERMNIWRGTGLTFSHTSKDRVDIVLDQKELERLKRVKAGQRVFVCDMTDLFGEHVPDRMIGEVWSAMISNPNVTFQVLTKRADRMRAVVTRLVAECAYKGLRYADNVWLGVSVEDQKTADERIPLLLETPAAVRFLSCEPLLGPIDLSDDGEQGAFSWLELGIHWVIAGGESGPGARYLDIAWVRSLRDQCQGAGVPVFVKQLGAKPYEKREGGKQDGAKFPLKLKNRKGGDWDEWPEDLRVRQFPQLLAAIS